ncbi:unnamed protein product [Peniophora sp. CBMAI 1063]|nr:unnamed protein product [Peniophora sp. CBMAI 1063]
MGTQSPHTVGDGVPKKDPYYGRKSFADVVTRFLVHTFACTVDNEDPDLNLDRFVAYALYRANLLDDIACAGLLFLHRFKAWNPDSIGMSGQRLFITAFMLANKAFCDSAYRTSSWCIVSQGLFNAREISEMERDMCFYLQWRFVVDNVNFARFMLYLRDNFAEPTSPGAWSIAPYVEVDRFMGFLPYPVPWSQYPAPPSYSMPPLYDAALLARSDSSQTERVPPSRGNSQPVTTATETVQSPTWTQQAPYPLLDDQQRMTRNSSGQERVALPSQHTDVPLYSPESIPGSDSPSSCQFFPPPRYYIHPAEPYPRAYSSC